MKVLLIAPPKKGIAGLEEYVPIGLGYLVTALRWLGHQPEVQDCIINRWGTAELLRFINSSRSDIVGVTVFSQALRNVRELLPLRITFLAA